MPRKTVASLEAELATVRKMYEDEKQRAFNDRSDAQALRERVSELEEARLTAEREASRLQGYIDRVREEQGVRVGDIEINPRWGPGHPDFDRFVHGDSARRYR